MSESECLSDGSLNSVEDSVEDKSPPSPRSEGSAEGSELAAELTASGDPVSVGGTAEQAGGDKMDSEGVLPPTAIPGGLDLEALQDGAKVIMTRVQSILTEATALGEAAKGIVSILTSGKLGTVGGAGPTPLTLQTIGATVQILYSDEKGDTLKNMPPVMVFEKKEKTYFRQCQVPIIGLYPGAVILSKKYGAPLQLVPLNLPIDAPLMRAIYNQLHRRV